MATYVTAVTLTTGFDDELQVPTWRLEWIENEGRRDTTFRMTHYSVDAARRHATSLCAKRPDGTTVADIFTDAR